MRHGSLFSGIGGFDLAAEWMGWENIFHCEWNPFGQKVLKHYWPDAISYDDITKTDFSIHRGSIDILTGGFPCQPFSIAGKRQGKSDERFLFYEVKRALREIKPGIVVLENVSGLLTILEPAGFSEVERKAIQFYDREHLLFNMQPAKRDKIEIKLKEIQERVVAEVIKEIESEGYLLPRTKKGEPIVLCVPACGVNAPHRRDRIWIVAYSDSNTNRHIRGQDREKNGLQSISGEAVHSGKLTGTNTGAITNANGNVHTRGLDNRGNSGSATGSENKNKQPEGWNENGEWIWAEPGTGSEIASDTNGLRLEEHELQQSELYRQYGERGITPDTASKGREEWEQTGGRKDATENSGRMESESERYGSEWDAANASNKGLQGSEINGSVGSIRTDGNKQPSRFFQSTWENFPTQPPLCNGDDGISSELDGITFSKWRNESIKAGGNAIVPQVAFEIFKAIEQTELIQAS